MERFGLTENEIKLLDAKFKSSNWIISKDRKNNLAFIHTPRGPMKFTLAELAAKIYTDECEQVAFYLKHG